jgi:hypothetical protein
MHVMHEHAADTWVRVAATCNNRIMGMQDKSSGQPIFRHPRDAAKSTQHSGVSGKGSKGGNDAVSLTVRPIYALDPQLERAWPLDVDMGDVPAFLSQVAMAS